MAEKAQKQSEQILRQKKEKEQRQMCEAFLGFDVRNFEQQVRKKLDPTNTKIASCSYDTVAKRFKVKFNSAADATSLTKGITMKKQKRLKFDSAVSILPSPVESRCHQLDERNYNEKAEETKVRQCRVNSSISSRKPMRHVFIPHV